MGQVSGMLSPKALVTLPVFLGSQEAGSAPVGFFAFPLAFLSPQNDSELPWKEEGKQEVTPRTLRAPRAGWRMVELPWGDHEFSQLGSV